VKKTREDNSSSAKSVIHGLQLLLVQSIVGLIILGVTLLFKVVGGSAFVFVKDQFQKGMFEQPLLFTSSVSSTTMISADVTTTTSHVYPSAGTVSVSAEAFEAVPPLIGGIVTSSYGERVDPITGETAAFHHGVDIAANEGTPLSALMNGTVTEVGYEEYGYGWYVIVQCTPHHHYLYAHCREIAATAGQSVRAGDVIAYVGNTGRSTGAHVHVEWRENGKAVDPMTMIPKDTFA